MKELGNDSSAVWKNIKNWCGWISSGPPTKLVDNGVVYSKPKELATIMNTQFISKVNSYRNQLSQNVGNPLTLVRNIMRSQTCTFNLRTVHPDEVNKVISLLKSSDSCGLDNINSRVIKLATKELLPAITHVINLSILQGIFPGEWKIAKVIPMHKKNETIYPANYRPVSLLPIFSKILERVVFNQLNEYFEENQLLHPSHHGFR